MQGLVQGHRPIDSHWVSGPLPGAKGPTEEIQAHLSKVLAVGQRVPKGGGRPPQWGGIFLSQIPLSCWHGDHEKYTDSQLTSLFQFTDSASFTAVPGGLFPAACLWSAPAVQLGRRVIHRDGSGSPGSLHVC